MYSLVIVQMQPFETGFFMHILCRDISFRVVQTTGGDINYRWALFGQEYKWCSTFFTKIPAAFVGRLKEFCRPLYVSEGFSRNNNPGYERGCTGFSTHCAVAISDQVFAIANFIPNIPAEASTLHSLTL